MYENEKPLSIYNALPLPSFNKKNKKRGKGENGDDELDVMLRTFFDSYNLKRSKPKIESEVKKLEKTFFIENNQSFD